MGCNMHTLAVFSFVGLAGEGDGTGFVGVDVGGLGLLGHPGAGSGGLGLGFGGWYSWFVFSNQPGVTKH